VRIKSRWIVLLFLLGCGAIQALCFGGTNVTTPLYKHDDPRTEREFQNVYQTAARSPSILSGSGSPDFAPAKSGDIYVSTSTAHVYIATGTKDSNSWLQVK
jgi:hypothetical protein